MPFGQIVLVLAAAVHSDIMSTSELAGQFPTVSTIALRSRFPTTTSCTKTIESCSRDVVVNSAKIKKKEHETMPSVEGASFSQFRRHAVTPSFSTPWHRTFRIETWSSRMCLSGTSNESHAGTQQHFSLTAQHVDHREVGRTKGGSDLKLVPHSSASF